MLRLIINTPRRRTTTSATTTTNHDDAPQVEPWQEYIKRATTIAERTLSNQHVETWDVTYLRRKWRWASRLATQHHDRWSRLAYTWQPHLDLQRPAYRRHGRPNKRWDDDIHDFIQTTRREPASDPTNNSTTILRLAADWRTWDELEESFIQFMQLRAPPAGKKEKQAEGEGESKKEIDKQ